MKALIGRKLGMTQIFGERGKTQAVTLLQAGPCVVTQVKTADKDGYIAVQLGFGEAKKLSKPATGHLKSSQAKSRYLREFRVQPAADDADTSGELKVGDKLDASQFEVGDEVTIVGISRGKGFAGTIKRHNFSRGPKTHGSMSYRRPGSIGSMYPQKVFKGQKMSGRMGNDRVTLQKVKIAEVKPEEQLLAIAGPVPGPRKGLVLIEASNG